MSSGHGLLCLDDPYRICTFWPPRFIMFHNTEESWARVALTYSLLRRCRLLRAPRGITLICVCLTLLSTQTQAFTLHRAQPQQHNRTRCQIAGARFCFCLCVGGRKVSGATSVYSLMPGIFFFTQAANCFLYRMSTHDPKFLFASGRWRWHGHPFLHTCKYPHCSWALTFEQSRTDENTHIATWDFTARLSPPPQSGPLSVCIGCAISELSEQDFIHMGSVLIHVYMHVCVRATGCPILGSDCHHPLLLLLALRFLQNVSTAKTASWCLLRVAISLFCRAHPGL